MTRYFCTYFDQHYAPRGLALYRSLERHGSDFVLWVLCFDDEAYARIAGLGYAKLRPIRLAEFEARQPRLAAIKPTRSRVEYYFTCTPSLVQDVLDQHPEVELLTYLDADMYFFSSPEPLYDELEGQSVGIIAHRYPPALQHMDKFGIYNVGWVSFRRDADGMACLERWRDQCIEWCYDRYEDDRYGDQKYLDAWPRDFKGVVVLQHPGANVAPWNLARYRVSTSSGQPYVDEAPVVFFHFHGLKQINAWVFDPNLSKYGAALTADTRKSIFLPYLATVADSAPVVSRAADMLSSIRVTKVDLRLRIKQALYLVRGLLTRRLIINPAALK